LLLSDRFIFDGEKQLISAVLTYYVAIFYCVFPLMPLGHTRAELPADLPFVTDALRSI